MKDRKENTGTFFITTSLKIHSSQHYQSISLIGYIKDCQRRNKNLYFQKSVLEKKKIYRTVTSIF